VSPDVAQKLQRTGFALESRILNGSVAVSKLKRSDDSSATTGHNMIVSCGVYLIHPQELHRL
jgi:hypothetical protein